MYAANAWLAKAGVISPPKTAGNALAYVASLFTAATTLSGLAPMLPPFQAARACASSDAERPSQYRES